MFDKFFEKYPDFININCPTEDDIKLYQDKLPAKLIEFWEQYGYGIYMDGYLKIVHPDEYNEIFSVSYAHYKNTEIPFAVTAFGDLFVWANGAVRLIDYRHGISSIVSSSKIERLFESRLLSENYLSKYFKWDNYLPAKEKLGAPNYDECYAYEPILALGGSEKVENITKVKIKEHLLIINELAGKVK